MPKGPPQSPRELGEYFGKVKVLEPSRIESTVSVSAMA
jgi:hypothetical protein